MNSLSNPPPPQVQHPLGGGRPLDTYVLYYRKKQVMNSFHNTSFINEGYPIDVRKTRMLTVQLFVNLIIIESRVHLQWF